MCVVSLRRSGETKPNLKVLNNNVIIRTNCFLSVDDFSDKDICNVYQGLARFPHPSEERGEICCNSTKICYANHLNTTWEHQPELPDCPENIEPEFYMFTPENGKHNFTIFHLTFHNLEKARNMEINSSRQFFTIIHGWNTDFWHSWVIPMKDALVNQGYNVMIVNWANGSNIYDYVKSVANTRTVADAVVRVMKFLNHTGKIKLANSTLIGFSLGAHIAGQAGGKLENLWRIIGLDPAGPYFVCEDPLARLDETDAQFVLVIHTNGDTILDGGLGTLEPMGHIDFYPDGGIIQPGCFTAPKNIFNSLEAFDFSKLSDALSCSHTRATTLWLDIIKQAINLDLNQMDSRRCFFKSFPCEDSKSWRYGKCFECGDNDCPLPNVYASSTNIPQRGKYFFNTLASFNESGHFCGRQYKLTLTAEDSTKGQILVILKGNRTTELSDLLEFQKERHTIKGGIPRSEILVAPWSLSNVTQILLTYKTQEETTKLPSKLTLLNCTLTNENGQKFYWSGKVTAAANETVEINLINLKEINI